jgi:hypothetical protein
VKGTSPPDTPKISTILLNWNRKHLLRETIESYIRETKVDRELIVIDNGSTDGGRQYLEDLVAKSPEIRLIALDENEGGVGLNRGIGLAKGSIVHISGNDQRYLPGWDVAVLEKFETFPLLGQLSAHGPTPVDGEAWESRPVTQSHVGGVIIYRTTENVGTTSFLRREVFDRGVLVKSQPADSGLLFPDNEELSRQVRELGYLVAFNDYPVAENLGHLTSELDANDSLHSNYLDGRTSSDGKEWKELLREAKNRPKPRRTSFLFPKELSAPEISRPSVECPDPLRWTMLDSWTAEVEVLEFLYALVRLIKPSYILETGTWLGAGAVAIGEALRDNGFGNLSTIEIDPLVCSFAKDRIRRYELDSYVEVLEGSSFDFSPKQPIDFLFLDSAIDIRGQEFRRFHEFLAEGAVVAFHDTSESHQVVRAQIDQLVSDGLFSGLYFASPRGLVVGISHGAAKPVRGNRLAGSNDLELENEKLVHQLAEAEAKLSALTGSVSWKVTKPLRVVRRLL